MSMFAKTELLEPSLVVQAMVVRTAMLRGGKMLRTAFMTHRATGELSGLWDLGWVSGDGEPKTLLTKLIVTTRLIAREDLRSQSGTIFAQTVSKRAIGRECV